MALDKLVDSTQLDSALTATADAIRTKTGDANSITWNLTTGFASAIADIPTGSGDVGEGDIIFYDDLDHRIVKRYTPSQFAALTAMPNNPEHTGFISQGWNWDLSEAKTHVAKYGALNIGQMYMPSDYNTHIIVDIVGTSDAARRFYLSTMRIVPNSSTETIRVNWGDGSYNNAYSGTVDHTYSSPGTYEIIVDTAHASSPNSYIYFWSSSKPSTTTGSGTSSFDYYAGKIKTVYLGKRAYIATYGFSMCCQLETITIPYVNPNDTVGYEHELGRYAFDYCYALKSVTLPKQIRTMYDHCCNYAYSLSFVSIPNTVTTTENYLFQRCYALQSVTFPDGQICDYPSYMFQYCQSMNYALINSNGDYSNTFSYCSSITKVVIGENVDTISSSTFTYCYCIRAIYMLGVNPPSLNSTSAFNSFPSGYQIFVPSETARNAYIGATNWSNFSDHIVVGSP